MIAEAKRLWLRHPMTVAARRELEQRRERAFTALTNRCKVTTDPWVAAAYADFTSILVALDAYGEPQEQDQEA